MGTNREHATDWSQVDEREYRYRRAGTPMEALMECRPFEDPDRSQAELLALRDILAGAVDQLAPLDRVIVEALVIERCSYRRLGRRLGLTHSTIQYKFRKAIDKLHVIVNDDTTVARYLEETQ